VTTAQPSNEVEMMMQLEKALGGGAESIGQLRQTKWRQILSRLKGLLGSGPIRSRCQQNTLAVQRLRGQIAQQDLEMSLKIKKQLSTKLKISVAQLRLRRVKSAQFPRTSLERLKGPALVQTRVATILPTRKDQFNMTSTQQGRLATKPLERISRLQGRHKGFGLHRQRVREGLRYRVCLHQYHRSATPDLNISDEI
jgi:hypothetical protein